jgi:hypothetical protein
LLYVDGNERKSKVLLSDKFVRRRKKVIQSEISIIRSVAIYRSKEANNMKLSLRIRLEEIRKHGGQIIGNAMSLELNVTLTIKRRVQIPLFEKYKAVPQHTYGGTGGRGGIAPIHL